MSNQSTAEPFQPLKFREARCTVCGQTFRPKTYNQASCTPSCSRERERRQAEAKRRGGDVPVSADASVPAEYDPVRWVINPVRHHRPLRAGEPLYVQVGENLTIGASDAGNFGASHTDAAGLRIESAAEEAA